ncbi:hypothetical protein [Microbacterium sp. SORGH_AS_0888]|uniref:hypothetical protein n=1 Tax=Microbacterium sp. SORGH_AS_0888 TaxID=3041791 RepID=UPI00278AE3E0|nr:hypothetical protein [Microbacterium sp. SORGH_AS_0888]MDQ1130366.1 hypothetical protein [Microbacterium sp. SORGH_AS_0888]
MRWFGVLVAVVTVVGVMVLGFVPTSAGLSNNVGALECRAVLAPIESASLIGDTRDQDLVERWLVGVGYNDPGELPTVEQMTRVDATISAVCAEAQQTRSTWMVLIAVFGTGLALAAGLRSSPRGATGAVREGEG